jgi:hypothetical protein
LSSTLDRDSSEASGSSGIFLKVKKLFDQLRIKIIPVPLDLFSKKPTRAGWNDPDYDPNTYSWARHYGNIGIVVGRSNLLVFDCDTSETVSFFEGLAKKVGLDLNTLVVQTRKGRHYYYYCEFSGELERKQFHNDRIKLDVIAGNKYQVVAPYSQLKVGKNGEILDPHAKDYNILEYTPINIPEKLPNISREQYEALLQELEKTCKPETKQAPKQDPKHSQSRKDSQSREARERKLSSEEIQKIAEIVSPFFIEGQRQNFLFFLAGFLRKELKIAEESVIKLYEHFIDKDDKQDLKARLEAIKRTYQKDIETVSGWKGLVETLGETNARKLVGEICEILNIEHYKAKEDIFIEFSERKVIKIDNVTKEIELVRVDKEGNLNKLQRVFACVFEIYVLRNLLSKESFKYEFRCISNHPIEKEFVARGNLQEIWEQIYANTSYVEMPAIAETVLKKVSNYYFEKGWYEEKLEELPKGFYYAKEGGIEFIFASQFDNKYSKDELVKAANLLNEYVSSHPNPQLISSVLKAGLLLPFSFTLKQRGTKNLMKWLYLHGATRTGKTTTAKVIQAIWNHEYITNWASFCTEARAARHLASSTFPIIIDEVGETMENQNISLMLKMVFEEQIARQIQTKTHKTMTFPALAPLIMTSNTYFPNDPAYLNRFHIFHFPKNTQIPPAQRQKFSKRELFETLPPIGGFVWDYIIQHRWHDNYIEYATEILRALFLETLHEIPDWVEMPFITSNAETEEEQEAEREAIFYSALLAFLHAKVRKTELKGGKYQFAKEVYADLVDMRFGFLYSDGWNMYITKELIETCRKYSNSFNFKTLADIAEITGWQKEVKKIKGKATWVLKTDIVNFLYQLNLIPKRLTRIEFEQFLKGIDVFGTTIDEKVLDSIEQEVEREIPF